MFISIFIIMVIIIIIIIIVIVICYFPLLVLKGMTYAHVCFSNYYCLSPVSFTGNLSVYVHVVILFSPVGFEGNLPV